MDDKKKNLIKELLRYLVAGGSAFVFDLITKTLFHSLILPEDMGTFSVLGFENEVRVTLATTAGFLVGLIVNYVISIFFVFTSEHKKGSSVLFTYFRHLSSPISLINESISSL